jgi:translation initiation factor 1A
MEHGMARSRRKDKTEPFVVKRVKLPNKPKGEMLGVVTEFNGGSRFTAICEDNKRRRVRIPGKLKKRMWVRPHDVVIIRPWVVQSDEKADLVYRYIKAQRTFLKRHNLLPEVLDI